jgi:hypothetical protein
VGTPSVSVRPVAESDGGWGGGSIVAIVAIVVIGAGAAAFGAWRARRRK